MHLVHSSLEEPKKKDKPYRRCKDKKFIDALCAQFTEQMNAKIRARKQANQS